ALKQELTARAAKPRVRARTSKAVRWRRKGTPLATGRTASEVSAESCAKVEAKRPSLLWHRLLWWEERVLPCPWRSGAPFARCVVREFGGELPQRVIQFEDAALGASDRG